MKNIFVFLLIVFAFSISSAQYTLTTERIGGATHNGEFNTFRTTISLGKISNTIQIQLPYDVPYPAYYFSEEKGILILVHSFDGFMDVYSNNGKKSWSVNFFKEMSPNYERTVYCTIGKSSIVILTSDVTLPTARVHKYLFNGAKQWETELPYPLGMNIAMSEDEQTIIAGSYFANEKGVQQSTSIVSSKGEIQNNIDFLFRKAVFSEDNKFAALTSNYEARIISLETKKEITKLSTQMNDGTIVDALWNNNQLLVQEAKIVTPDKEKIYFENPEFTLYSSTGKVLKQYSATIEYHTSQLQKSSGTIEFKYDKTGKKLLFAD